MASLKENQAMEQTNLEWQKIANTLTLNYYITF